MQQQIPQPRQVPPPQQAAQYQQPQTFASQAAAAAAFGVQLPGSQPTSQLQQMHDLASFLIPGNQLYNYYLQNLLQQSGSTQPPQACYPPVQPMMHPYYSQLPSLTVMQQMQLASLLNSQQQQQQQQSMDVHGAAPAGGSLPWMQSLDPYTQLLLSQQFANQQLFPNNPQELLGETAVDAGGKPVPHLPPQVARMHVGAAPSPLPDDHLLPALQGQTAAQVPTGQAQPPKKKTERPTDLANLANLEQALIKLRTGPPRRGIPPQYFTTHSPAGHSLPGHIPWSGPPTSQQLHHGVGMFTPLSPVPQSYLLASGHQPMSHSATLSGIQSTSPFTLVSPPSRYQENPLLADLNRQNAVSICSDVCHVCQLPANYVNCNQSERLEICPLRLMLPSPSKSAPHLKAVLLMQQACLWSAIFRL